MRAIGYLEKAAEFYAGWGAVAKVEHIETILSRPPSQSSSIRLMDVPAIIE